VLPPHFLEARHRALLRAQEYEMSHGGPVTPLPRDLSAPPARQLTVGATPIDGRYGVGPPMHGQYGDGHHHHQHPHYGLSPHSHQMGPPGPQTPNEHGYYMQESPMMNGEHPNHGQGFASEYEAVGQHSTSIMGDTAMAAYHQQQTPPHYDHQQQQQHHQQQHPQYHQEESPQYQQYGNPNESPHSNAGSQLQYQDDDRSRQSSSFQREVEEEGAILDTNAAP